MTPVQTYRAPCAALLGLALLLGVSHAAAADAAPADSEALGNHQKNLRLEAGVRTQFVSSAGLNAFSKNDVVPHLSLGASLGFWARDRLSVAGFVGFDYASQSEKVRSDRATLDIARFTLAPELRYHVLRVLALTAKLGPTLTREGIEVSGGLGTATKAPWKLGFDATAGAALELWGYRSGAAHKPRLWLVAEGGYGFTAPTRLRLTPDESGAAPQRLTPLDLGELAFGGPLFRISAALSFW